MGRPISARCDGGRQEPPAFHNRSSYERSTATTATEVTPQPIAEPDLAAAARKTCLNVLAARARTRAELLTKLQAKAIPDDICNEVLDRFGALGLIDDKAYAEAFVASRRRDRGLSRTELTRQLKVKGVAAELISAALADVDDDDEYELALREAHRKLRTMGRLDEAAAARRLVAMLARKGYSSATSYAAVRAAVGLARGKLGEQEGGG